MIDVTLVRGHWIVPDASSETLTDAAVLVRDGRIAEVGAWSELSAAHPTAPVIGCDRFAVLPGMINAHHHSLGASALQHGIPDLLLEPWILAHAGMRPGDARLDTLLSAARLLRSGVTAVVDLRNSRGTPEAYAQNIGDALRAYDLAGLRVALGAGFSTRSHLVAGEDDTFLAALPPDVRLLAETLLPAADNIDADDYFAILAELRDDFRDRERIEVCFGPPGPQWISDDFMQRIAETAEAWDCSVQTHVNESFYEKLHGPRAYGKATICHLRDLGVLSPRFSIAHGVWLTEEEIAVMAESGAAVSHNPSSNLRLRAGIAPLNALLEAGVTVGLGMDGTTLNDDEDMWCEMRLALRLNRTTRLDGPAPSVAQIFGLATSGGAKLLRQEANLGRIAPGAAADLVLIDLERLSAPWLAPDVAPLTLLLSRAAAGDVHTVLVAGEVVLAAGRPTRFDAAAAAEELAARLRALPPPPAGREVVARLLPSLEVPSETWDVPELTPYSAYNSRT